MALEVSSNAMKMEMSWHYKIKKRLSCKQKQGKFMKKSRNMQFQKKSPFMFLKSKIQLWMSNAMLRVFKICVHLQVETWHFLIQRVWKSQYQEFLAVASSLTMSK